MNLTAHIAKQIRDVHFGGNWTASNLKQHLTSLTWQEATTRVGVLNSISALVFHMNYYTCAVSRVLQGSSLDASDKFSFDQPPILSQRDWDNLLEKTWADADVLADLVEKSTESRLWEDFSNNQYGDYYRNILGVIEHIHYHLGQIVLIKKILIQAP
jgi:hypothetical protein